MEGVAEATRPRRRRRTPAEAEQEIIAAAEALLREHPFRHLTVDEVMRRTELSRPSFYVYFRDRHHLVLRVVEHIGSELQTMADRWFKGGQDGPGEVRSALEGVVTVFAEHGPVLQALADAATDDPDVEVVYGALVQGFIDVTAEHIRTESAARRLLTIADAEQMARALVLMTERYLLATMGRGPSVAAATITETLTSVWVRSLYGNGPASA